MRNPATIAAYWLASFIAYLATVLLVGAVVGAITFTTIGTLSHPHLEPSYRLAKGISNGMLLALVWGPAISLVLCFMQGHRRNRAKATQSK